MGTAVARLVGLAAARRSSILSTPPIFKSVFGVARLGTRFPRSFSTAVSGVPVAFPFTLDQLRQNYQQWDIPELCIPNSLYSQFAQILLYNASLLLKNGMKQSLLCNDPIFSSCITESDLLSRVRELLKELFPPCPIALDNEEFRDDFMEWAELMKTWADVRALMAHPFPHSLAYRTNYITGSVRVYKNFISQTSFVAVSGTWCDWQVNYNQEVEEVAPNRLTGKFPIEAHQFTQRSLFKAVERIEQRGQLRSYGRVGLLRLFRNSMEHVNGRLLILIDRDVTIYNLNYNYGLVALDAYYFNRLNQGHNSNFKVDILGNVPEVVVW